MSQINTTCDIWDRFASRLASPDEAPEPLRSALRENLPSKEEVRILVFGPASKGLDKRWPATVLAVTDRSWVAVSGLERGQPTLTRSDFVNTLLVELTDILLYGALRVDFATGGRAQCVTFYFNTVMVPLYHEAVQLLVDGMDGVRPSPPEETKHEFAHARGLPLKFRNALLEDMLAGQEILNVLYWPAVLGKKRAIFQRELAPQALLARTERELIFICEEKSGSWLRKGRTERYGSIATYCPLSRIARIQVSEPEDVDTVHIEIRAPQGGEKMKIDFPRQLRLQVEAFLERTPQPHRA